MSRTPRIPRAISGDTRTSSADVPPETLGAVKRTIRIVEKMDAGWVMLSQVPASSKKVADEGEAAVQGYGLKLVPHKFMTRADFAYSMSGGLAATEFDFGGLILRSDFAVRKNVDLDLFFFFEDLLKLCDRRPTHMSSLSHAIV